MGLKLIFLWWRLRASFQSPESKFWLPKISSILLGKKGQQSSNSCMSVLMEVGHQEPQFHFSLKISTEQKVKGASSQMSKTAGLNHFFWTSIRLAMEMTVTRHWPGVKFLSVGAILNPGWATFKNLSQRWFLENYIYIV